MIKYELDACCRICRKGFRGIDVYFTDGEVNQLFRSSTCSNECHEEYEMRAMRDERMDKIDSLLLGLLRISVWCLLIFACFYFGFKGTVVIILLLILSKLR